MKTLDAAIKYRRRGWMPIPVPYMTKAPILDEWQRLRPTEADLPALFRTDPSNIGTLMGEPSNWLVDVDLDHPACLPLAEQWLPPTPLFFGRPGNPKSHWLYRVTGPVKSRRIKSNSAGTIIELRSTGLQTVFPPSVHELGEPIIWENEDAEPLEIDSDTLLEIVLRIGHTVLEQLGERSRKKKKEPKKPPRSNVQSKPDKCLAAMLKMKMEDHKDGSSRLFAAACRVVEYDLNDVEGIAAIRDYARQKPFPNEWSDEDILKRIRDADLKTTRGTIRRAPPPGGKPTIVIDTEEFRVIDEAVAALKADTTIYQRGGLLVRTLRDEELDDGITRSSGSATISPVPSANLRERLTKVAEFSRFARQGENIVEVAAHPTPWLVAGVEARGQWPSIRHLTAISDAPVLRPDGSLWQTPGYDIRTSVIFEPSAEFPNIPESPTLDDALAALQDLKEVVCDFRFESEDHLAAWLAALLTALARFAFDGPAPLFLIDANVRGAGKGLLAQTIGKIVLGREMPVSGYAPKAEEMQKRITSIAIAGDRMVLLDNLEGKFGNDALDRALTATRWRDRILGTNDQVDLPLTAVWFATGNNVTVAADTARRIVHIRLDVLEERPEERRDFRHPNLLEWVHGQRPRLLSHALTILSAYCHAGRPTPDMTPYGSFEGWSALIRGALLWVGMPDPCNTRSGLAASSDTTHEVLTQLIHAWQIYDPTNTGIVFSDLIGKLYPPGNAPDDASTAMRAAIENLMSTPAGQYPAARQIGNRLRRFRRRVVDKCYLDVASVRNRNGTVWKLHSNGSA